MSKFCLKYIVTFFVFVFFVVFWADPVFADRTINSVTLNGSSSVTVSPSSSITALVNVTISAGSNWQSTSWQISGQSVSCVDHTDYTSSGTFSENLTVTAPVSTGTYDISFIGYGNNACSSSASNTYTLTSGITVAMPTSTPTPTSGPTSTPVPGGPTATPTSAPSSSSTSSVTYYPSVALAVFLPNPTRQTSLTFSGTAAITQGTIQLVEYTITDGISFLAAQPQDGNFNGKDENFTFSISNLAEGKYTIKARAKSAAGVLTQDGSYASQTITISTTPPTVTLDKIAPNPTKNQTPILTGIATAKFADIAKVEVSIDNGKSWQIAKRSGNTFSITLSKLEDGNYRVSARAFDTAGNIGKSDIQTLIIDTIPPVIGGSMQSMGPQVLTPNKNGMVSIVAGAETTIAVSMKGGVTEAKIRTSSDSFKLFPKEGTNIWVGKIKFDTGGEKPLTILAVDGAGNTTERKFNTLTVESSGIVEDKKTKKAIKGAKVSLYIFEAISQQWILWEAESYGQRNPQKTDDKGSYSFMVPAGKYYMEVMSTGYHTLQSEILTLSETTILNFTISFRSKPKLKFSLPFIGDVIFTIPSISWPETFYVPKVYIQKQLAEDINNLRVGTIAPNFSLPNLENKEVKLADFKGKKLLLSFIAPWSAHSLEQAPFLSEISSSLKENHSILVVSLQESVAATLTLMKKGNYKFPVVADKDGITASAYKITILPHHVLIDENGKIEDTFTGVFTKKELMKKINIVP